MKLRVTVYQDGGAEWRWQMNAGNNARIGASTEGYRDRGHALENLKMVTGFTVKLSKGHRGDVYFTASGPLPRKTRP